MGKREKHRAKVALGYEEGTPKRAVSRHSSDDEEANEDLSLKIVEKAILMRAAKLNSRIDEDGEQCGNGVCEVVEVSSKEADAGSGSSGEAVVANTVKKSKKKKKNETVEVQEQQCVVDLKAEEKVELVDASEGKIESTNLVDASEGKIESTNLVDASEGKIEMTNSDPAENSDNMVFKKLLRGPRYFDPPDSGWGACYNCGEEGHTTLNCTSARRKKPCFVCGSLDHTRRQCLKGQDCYLCKKGGHRAKDCPEKQKGGSQNSKICLKCCQSGHDMFSCRSDYCADDLKDIQCYICRSFGHLCCVNVAESSPLQVSCYKCGQLGHTGLACTKLRGESNGESTPSSCYRCGEEGHFARECTSSSKAFPRSFGDGNGTTSPSSCYRCGGEGHFARECVSHSHSKVKGNGKMSTPSLRSHKDNRSVKSAPNDIGKVRKRKKGQSEESGTAPRKSKHRGGWIMDDPSEFSDMKPEGSGTSHRKSKHRGGWIMDDAREYSDVNHEKKKWKSPATAATKGNKKFTSSGGQNSSSRSPKKIRKPNFGNSAKKGSANSPYKKYSSSRFNNSSDYGSNGYGMRNYDWW